MDFFFKKKTHDGVLSLAEVFCIIYVFFCMYAAGYCTAFYSFKPFWRHAACLNPDPCTVYESLGCIWGTVDVRSRKMATPAGHFKYLKNSLFFYFCFFFYPENGLVNHTLIGPVGGAVPPHPSRAGIWSKSGTLLATHRLKEQIVPQTVEGILLGMYNV